MLRWLSIPIYTSGNKTVPKFCIKAAKTGPCLTINAYYPLTTVVKQDTRNVFGLSSTYFG